MDHCSCFGTAGKQLFVVYGQPVVPPRYRSRQQAAAGRRQPDCTPAPSSPVWLSRLGLATCHQASERARAACTLAAFALVRPDHSRGLNVYSRVPHKGSTSLAQRTRAAALAAGHHHRRCRRRRRSVAATSASSSQIRSACNAVLHSAHCRPGPAGAAGELQRAGGTPFGLVSK